MRKLLFLLIGLFLSCQVLRAQTRTITGKITDVSGRPVSYSSIKIKDGKGGATADADGYFTLKVTGNAGTLIVSSLGFKDGVIPFPTENTLTVRLTPNSKQMDEVVVTALGIKRSKNSLPYAMQQLTADEVNKVPGTNVLSSLSGKVAGLQITTSNGLGASNNVILRGLKSLTQSNQALFVVDGVPFDNSNQTTAINKGVDLGSPASDINPDDIESVSVLKGGAASALYGSRGAQGVILITTKKGRKRVGIGLTVNTGVQVGIPDKSTLPVYQTQYGEGYGSAGYNSNFPNQDGFFYWTPTRTSGGQNVNVVQTDIDQATGPAYDASKLVYNGSAFSPSDPNYGKATPWVASKYYKPTDFFETPVTSIFSAFMDGGGDKGTFKLGFTNNNDKGLMPNSSALKNQLNFGATYAATDRVTLGGNINYVGETGIGRNYYVYSGAGGGPMNDFRQFWATNIDLHALKHDYFASKANETWNWNGGYVTNTAGNLAAPAYHNNTYFAAYQNYNNDSRNRFFGNANVNYKITDNLNMLARVSQDRYDQLLETRTAVGSATTASYYRYNGSFAETNYDLIFNLDRNITSDLNLKALLGGNVRQQDISYISAVTNGGLVIPGFYALSNSAKTPNAPIESDVRRETNSVFSGVTFTYKEMVTLDGTLRRDQSSTLPKANNTYYYPAVSASFTFSRLLKDLNWLSYGKVRANYSTVGNDAPPYSTNNTFIAGTNFNGQPQFTYTTTNNNINLKPENNQNYELGLEASFLHSRLGFDVTYYHSRMMNQIMPITPSTATGFNNFYVNGGTVQNSGLEVMMNLIPLKTNDWTWSMNLNWAKNQSRVISLYGGQPSYVIASLQNSIQLVAEVGSAYGILRGSDYQYLNGKPLIDATGTPVLSTNKKSDIGNINPDWLGGISNTISYKNLAFSFLVDIRQGGKVYSLDMDYGSTSGLYPETAGLNGNGKSVRSPLVDGGGIVLPGVTADGKPNQTRFDASDINTGHFPFGSVNGIMAASSYVYDASYVKLREVALTWSVPKKAIAKIAFLKGLDLSLTSRNPWIIHKNLPYNDPEQGQASGNASMGFQTGAYPSIKTFGCNVKLKF